VTRISTAKPPVDEPIDRRQEILKIAAALFKKTGYDRVSMRQIAAGAGILGGSLYHHFESKRTLFIEIHKQALSNNAARIEAAISDLTDPWERLGVACTVHLSLQVDPESISMPMMSDTSAMSSDMRKDLVKDRDSFEKIYRKLIDALPLRPEIDRNMYRLTLVSLLNAVPAWYRPGRLSIREVARQIILIFRASGLDAEHASGRRTLRIKR
jgi:AcrR family transcriptional regulator